MIPDFTSLNYFNLSPQGDENITGSRSSRTWSPPISTYPRKGTETAPERNVVQALLKFQFIPARGRKRGNHLTALTLIRFQLIPARGRKLELRCGNNMSLKFQLIPARGRKRASLPEEQQVQEFQLIPARGRKLIELTGVLLHDISTYPRKGTKNSASKKMRSFSFANLNSLFSVGYFSMNRAAAAFSLPWLSYCDKMCYNRANSKHLLQNTQTHFLFIVQFFHNL